MRHCRGEGEGRRLACSVLWVGRGGDASVEAKKEKGARPRTRACPEDVHTLIQETARCQSGTCRPTREKHPRVRTRKASAKVVVAAAATEAAAAAVPPARQTAHRRTAAQHLHPTRLAQRLLATARKTMVILGRREAQGSGQPLTGPAPPGQDAILAATPAKSPRAPLALTPPPPALPTTHPFSPTILPPRPRRSHVTRRPPKKQHKRGSKQRAKRPQLAQRSSWGTPRIRGNHHLPPPSPRRRRNSGR